MKSKNAPQLKSVLEKADNCGHAGQGDTMFNHRNEAGIKEYGAVSRLRGGFVKPQNMSDPKDGDDNSYKDV